MYTARGVVSENDTTTGNPQKIPLFDGKFTTGYRVVEFKIWGSDFATALTPDAIGKLSKNELGSTSAGSFMRADDDNQIAWAVTAGEIEAASAGGFSESIIDPDNLIIEDLYVYVLSRNSETTEPINYLIMMEKYSVTDWQGALAMARDKAQE